MSSYKPTITEERLAEIEARARDFEGDEAASWVLDLVADLRASRAEIERLKGEADRRVAEEREACAEACVEVMNDTDGAESRGAWFAALRIRARGEGRKP